AVPAGPPARAPSTRGSGRSSTRRPDLPRPGHEQGELVAGAGHAADGNVIRADHEVDVDLALIDPRQIRRVGDRMRVGIAEREMARGVLVEQDVEEGPAQPADAAFPIDERNLAEARGAVVRRAALAQSLRVRVPPEL